MKEEKLTVIKKALLKIGLKCDVRGYIYLIKGIEIAIENPDIVYSIGELYSIIALMFNVKNPARVRSNIQSLMSKTQNIRGFGGLNRLFKIEIVSANRKPSAGELIWLVAEYYNLGLYKN